MSVQLAQVDIGKELKLKPGEGGISTAQDYGSLGEFISAVLPNIYVAASLILLVLLIVGGFVIISSSADPQKKGQGAKAVTAALAGFVIIFISFWLIKLIEYITGVQIFNPQNINP